MSGKRHEIEGTELARPAPVLLGDNRQGVQAVLAAEGERVGGITMDIDPTEANPVWLTQDGKPPEIVFEIDATQSGPKKPSQSDLSGLLGMGAEGLTDDDALLAEDEEEAGTDAPEQRGEMLENSDAHSAQVQEPPKAAQAATNGTASYPALALQPARPQARRNKAPRNPSVGTIVDNNAQVILIGHEPIETYGPTEIQNQPTALGKRTRNLIQILGAVGVIATAISLVLKFGKPSLEQTGTADEASQKDLESKKDNSMMENTNSTTPPEPPQQEKPTEEKRAETPTENSKETLNFPQNLEETATELSKLIAELEKDPEKFKELITKLFIIQSGLENFGTFEECNTIVKKGEKDPCIFKPNTKWVRIDWLRKPNQASHPLEKIKSALLESDVLKDMRTKLQAGRELTLEEQDLVKKERALRRLINALMKKIQGH